MNGIPEGPASAPVSAPIRTPVEALGSLAHPAPTGFLRAAWDHWKKIARAIGVVQTRLLMVVMYFIFVVPLGLVARMRADPLHLRAPKGSNWMPHRHQPPNLESARRQS